MTHRPVRVAQWTPSLLVALCIALLPFGRLVEIPVLIMAVAGLYLAVRDRSALWRPPAARYFTWVFLGIWLPIVLSLPDAINVDRTTVVAVDHLRFLFSGLFIIHTLGHPRAQRRVTGLCTWVLAVWVLDALIQLAFGADLLGQPPHSNRITGLFGDSLKMGVVLPALAPILFEAARRQGRAALALAVIATVGVVLVANSRSGWVELAVVGAVYLGLLRMDAGRIPLATSVWFVVLISAAATVSYYASPDFARRIERTATQVLHFDPRGAPNALAHRYWISTTASRMFADHPVNGVGARGFRYAFRDYVRSDDPYANGELHISPTNSHNLILEVGTETGTLGLAGLTIALALLLRLGWRGRHGKLWIAYGAGLAAVYFPLNSHHALYSAFWGQLVWWITALFFAAAAADEEALGATAAARGVTPATSGPKRQPPRCR